jgi:hypothetical protein
MEWTMSARPAPAWSLPVAGDLLRVRGGPA